MAALLTTLGEVVTAVLGYIGTICTTIVGQPLLLLTTGFLLIGGCIGIFGRLLSKGCSFGPVFCVNMKGGVFRGYCYSYGFSVD